MLKKLLFILPIFSFFSCGFSNLSEDDYDYACQIIDSRSYTCTPDIYNDSWRSYLECKFNNGLELCISYIWPLETQAEDAAKRFAKCFEVGKCGNIIFKTYLFEKFNIYHPDIFVRFKKEREVFEIYNELRTIRKDISSIEKYLSTMSIYTTQPLFDAPEMYMNTLLSDASKSHSYISFDLSSTIRNFFILIDIHEEIEEWGGGWFTAPEKFYKYVLSLSNGKKFITPKKKEIWKTSWEVGSNICIIGNEKNPILINIDAQQGSEINLSYEGACQRFYEYTPVSHQ